MNKDFLMGAYDLHIHSAPDVVPRKRTDFELAKRLSGLGYRGFAIKSHMFGTGARAAAVRELYPGINAVGCLALNRSVGGINPAAVEMEGRIGTKIVYFPTVDSKSEQEFNARTGRAKSYGAGASPSIHIPPVAIFAGDGKLLPEVYTVLELIKRYDMVMCTGHMSPVETLALLKAGKDLGLEKMMVTHPEFPACFAGAQEQLEYVRLGAMIEYCYHTVWSGVCPHDTVYEFIRAVGPGHAVITSDFGQASSPDPEEGFLEYISLLLESGFSEMDVKKMIATNPAGLVE